MRDLFIGCGPAGGVTTAWYDAAVPLLEHGRPLAIEALAPIQQHRSRFAVHQGFRVTSLSSRESDVRKCASSLLQIQPMGSPHSGVVATLTPPGNPESRPMLFSLL